MIPKINIIQELQQITVIGTNNMTTILPFNAIATENGQTVFTILGPTGNPIVFRNIICLFVMGTGQDPLNTPPDYTVIGSQVTLGTGAPILEIGNVIYGAGQI